MRGGGRRAGGYSGDDRRGGGRGVEEPKRKEEKDLKAKQFDLVFLDPPTWSKSKHGAVDLVRDYQVRCGGFARRKVGLIYGGNLARPTPAE